MCNIREACRPDCSPFFCPTGQRGQQGGAGQPTARRHYPGDQRGKHGRHAERGGPEQDQELQDPAAAYGGEVR